MNCAMLLLRNIAFKLKFLKPLLDDKFFLKNIIITMNNSSELRTDEHINIQIDDIPVDLKMCRTWR